jgi:hypothetical protein
MPPYDIEVWRREGAKAFRDGFPIATNPHTAAARYYWSDGWERAKIERQRAVYDIAHPVSDALRAVGIDPYELSDYLKNLPG